MGPRRRAQRLHREVAADGGDYAGPLVTEGEGVAGQPAGVDGVRQGRYVRRVDAPYVAARSDDPAVGSLACTRGWTLLPYVLHSEGSPRRPQRNFRRGRRQHVKSGNIIGRGRRRGVHGLTIAVMWDVPPARVPSSCMVPPAFLCLAPAPLFRATRARVYRGYCIGREGTGAQVSRRLWSDTARRRAKEVGVKGRKGGGTRQRRALWGRARVEGKEGPVGRAP